jgi:hypothetical protein
MYRRSKFLELLLNIRVDMAREADHDVDQFVQDLRTAANPEQNNRRDDTGLASGTKTTEAITAGAARRDS